MEGKIWCENSCMHNMFEDSEDENLIWLFMSLLEMSKLAIWEAEEDSQLVWEVVLFYQRF